MWTIGFEYIGIEPTASQTAAKVKFMFSGRNNKKARQLSLENDYQSPVWLKIRGNTTGLLQKRHPTEITHNRTTTIYENDAARNGTAEKACSCAAAMGKGRERRSPSWLGRHSRFQNQDGTHRRQPSLKARRSEIAAATRRLWSSVVVIDHYLR